MNNRYDWCDTDRVEGIEEIKKGICLIQEGIKDIRCGLMKLAKCKVHEGIKDIKKGLCSIEKGLACIEEGLKDIMSDTDINRNHRCDMDDMHHDHDCMHGSEMEHDCSCGHMHEYDDRMSPMFQRPDRYRW